MGEVLQMHRVGTAAEVPTAEVFTAQELSSDEVAGIGTIYEDLRRRNMAQVAGLVRDRLMFGAVQAETKERTMNELDGVALEALGAPFTKVFDYAITDRGVEAEDGELIVELNQRGYEVASEEAEVMRAQGIELGWLATRRQADVVNMNNIQALFTDPEVPVGTVIFGYSSRPAAAEVGVTEAVLETKNYSTAKLDMSMAWEATKTETGLSFRTDSYFHADPEALRQAAMRTTKQILPYLRREETPWQQILVKPRNEDEETVAEEFKRHLDDIVCEREGYETYHGMNAAELKHMGSQELLTEPEYLTARQATFNNLDRIAQSEIEGCVLFSDEVLQGMLTLRKKNGEFQLYGTRRDNIKAVLEHRPLSREVFEDVIESLYIVATTNHWATMSRLYHDGPVSRPSLTVVDTIYNGAASQEDEAMLRGMQEIQSQLNEGRAAGGCPGSGEFERSIFDMNSSERAQAVSGKEGWRWKEGVCAVEVCPTRPGKVKVGPCSVCEKCQAIFDHGNDPSEIYGVILFLAGAAIDKTKSWFEFEGPEKWFGADPAKVETEGEAKIFDLSLYRKSSPTIEKHEKIAA